MESKKKIPRKANRKVWVIVTVMLGLVLIILTLLKIYSNEAFYICEGGLALIGFADIGQIIYRFCKES